MVLDKKYFFFLVALFAAHIIFAQEPTNPPSDDIHNEGDDNSTQNRFFSFTRIVSCNYTSQPGRSCSSCRQSLVCGQNNVGIVRICKGFLPFCNQGICSFLPGSACSG